MAPAVAGSRRLTAEEKAALQIETQQVIAPEAADDRRVRATAQGAFTPGVLESTGDSYRVEDELREVWKPGDHGDWVMRLRPKGQIAQLLASGWLLEPPVEPTERIYSECPVCSKKLYDDLVVKPDNTDNDPNRVELGLPSGNLAKERVLEKVMAHCRGVHKSYYDRVWGPRMQVQRDPLAVRTEG